MKVSFDFDSTLTLPIIQEIAKRHISCNDDVHITTIRGIGLRYNNDDIFDIAKELKIPYENIHFTNMQDKVHFLETFDIHYDDDEYEIDLITRSNIKCIGILINYKNYNIDYQQFKR